MRPNPRSPVQGEDGQAVAANDNTTTRMVNNLRNMSAVRNAMLR